MTKRAFAVAAVTGLMPSVPAQTPSFLYSIESSPSLVAGQTATFTVLCGFAPGIGGTVSTPGGPRPVLGLSSGAFGIVCSTGAWSAPSLISPYTVGSPGAVMGSSVTGISWANGGAPPLGAVSTVNPSPVWTGTFTVSMPVGQWLAIIVNPVGPHSVWAGHPGEPAFEVFSDSVAGASLMVPVTPPAPSSAGVLAVAGMLAARRRR